MKKVLVLIAVIACYTGAVAAYITHQSQALVENLVALGNFILFVALLIKFAGPAIKNNFASNAREYQATVAEADKLLAEAKEMHQQWATKRDTLEQEIEQIKADAKSAAEAQATQIVENARQMAERLVADAERTAVSELGQAKDQLRDQLVDMVLTQAENKLQTRLTPPQQRVLIDEAIKKLEASG